LHSSVSKIFGFTQVGRSRPWRKTALDGRFASQTPKRFLPEKPGSCMKTLANPVGKQTLMKKRSLLVVASQCAFPRRGVFSATELSFVQIKELARTYES
jgi:hypothetical protein